MQLASVIILSEVEAPKIKLDLPVVRSGDRVLLNLVLVRLKNGRTEQLFVGGEFRVASVRILEDLRQEVTVDSIGRAPAWKAIKTKPSPARKLGPTRFPRRVVT